MPLRKRARVRARCEGCATAVEHWHRLTGADLCAECFEQAYRELGAGA